MALTFPSKAVSQENQKLNRLVNKSQHILYRISAVFPFDFYPDELIIDEN